MIGNPVDYDKKFKENFSIRKKLAYWSGLIETIRQDK